MNLADFFSGGDGVTWTVLSLSLLIMLYAMSLMNRAIRLLQYQVSVIEKDLKLMGEELKMIANRDIDALANGNLLYWDDLTTAKTVLNGDYGQFAVGTLVVKED